MEQAALRLATCAALLGGGAGPTFPTIAGEFVYDSMRDDIVDVVPEQRRPIIVVRTDENVVTYAKPHVALKQQARLLIEISVLTGVQGPDGKVVVIDQPKTDAALEVQLNILEWQVWNALFGYSEWALWFKKEMGYGGDILEYRGTPRFSPPNQGAVRVAVKTMEWIVQIPLECMIPARNETAPPEPVWLPSKICAVITKIVTDGGGDFRTAVIGLGGVLNHYAAAQPSRHPALRRVWTNLPDLEVETTWPIEQATALQWAPYTMGQATIGVPTLT